MTKKCLAGTGVRVVQGTNRWSPESPYQFQLNIQLYSKRLKPKSAKASRATHTLKQRPPCGGHVNSSEPGEWEKLPDGTAVYNLRRCELHDFSAVEARECLRNTHVQFIGDSLTRYQYLSFVHLLENGSYADRRIVYDYNKDHYVNRGDPNILREPDFHHEFHRRQSGQWREKFVWESR